MTFLVVLNLIALVLGFLDQVNLMYVLCGVIWTAFFPRYAKATWFIYERSMRGENQDTEINVWLMHEVATIIVMVSIYFWIWFKAGGMCGLAAIAQCLIFQGINISRRQSGKDVFLFICFGVELLFMVVCAL